MEGKGNNIPEKNSGNISSLRKRYSDEELIDSVYQAISSTRKLGKITERKWLKILQSWEKYPAPQVEGGVKTYLEKQCFSDPSKDEAYLLGIIRKQSPGIDSLQPQTTGSPLLDRHYGIGN